MDSIRSGDVGGSERHTPTPSYYDDLDDDFDGTSYQSAFSLDISDDEDTGDYGNEYQAYSNLNIDLKLDLNELDTDLPPRLSALLENGGEVIDHEVEGHPGDLQVTSRTDLDINQIDLARPKSSLKSFTPQYLSTGNRSERSNNHDNHNNNHNITFDQFLKTLGDDNGANSDVDSLPDDRTQNSNNGNNNAPTLASKSSVFSESSFHSEDDRTLKSESSFDLFGNIETQSKEESKEYDGPRTSSNYMSIPHGFQQRNAYEHSKKLTDLVDGE